MRNPKKELLKELSTIDGQYGVYSHKLAAKYGFTESEVNQFVKDGLLDKEIISTADGYRDRLVITQKGKDEIVVEEQKEIAARPAPDPERARLYALKDKARNGTITAEEKVEAIDLLLKL